MSKIDYDDNNRDFFFFMKPVERDTFCWLIIGLRCVEIQELKSVCVMVTLLSFCVLHK